MNSLPFLSVRGLSVTYRGGQRQVTALHDIDFDLSPGHRLALVGESGSGKSTLAMAIGLPAAEERRHLWIGFVPIHGRASAPRPRPRCCLSGP